jgi:hypothetical protein
MVQVKALNGNKFIRKFLKELSGGDEELEAKLHIIRELNRYDFDKAALITKDIGSKEMQLVYNDTVDKLTKIYLPTIFGKAIQIDFDNLITLPIYHLDNYQVLITDDKYNIIGIEPANKFPEEELIALVGRHPFKDTKGWTFTKVTFNNLDCIGISQKTLKERGGDFDGDPIMVILFYFDPRIRKEIEPKVTKVKYDTNEAIKLPVKMDKATLKKELKNIEIPEFDFKYSNNNHVILYPETISHIQNLETLNGAILMALNICGINITKQELLQQRDSIIQLIKTEIENIEDDSEREELLEIFSEIHETFITILVPIMYKDLNLPLYSSTIRLHLKDKGPAIFGYLQKILLSVANTRDEIKRVLDFIDLKQQEVIDLKKAENSILSFNSALNSKRSENLENNEQIADLYIKWKEETDANWSKNKWKLLFNNNPQDELDQLAVLDRFIDFE